MSRAKILLARYREERIAQPHATVEQALVVAANERFADALAKNLEPLLGGDPASLAALARRPARAPAPVGKY